jgi:hypothetical protein
MFSSIEGKEASSVTRRTRPLRVIQWATGSVGRHAVAAIA